MPQKKSAGRRADLGRRAQAESRRSRSVDLLRYREEFPILQSKVYLNSCSLGPLSRRSMAGLARFMELWNEHGAQAWYRLWLGEIDSVRTKVATIHRREAP